MSDPKSKLKRQVPRGFQPKFSWKLEEGLCQPFVISVSPSGRIEMRGRGGRLPAAE